MIPSGVGPDMASVKQPGQRIHHSTAAAQMPQCCRIAGTYLRRRALARYGGFLSQSAKGCPMGAKRVRFVQRRRSVGFTQERLAEHLGVERSTVGRWETAETEPQAWLRPKLARALKVTVNELQGLLDDVTVIRTADDQRLNYVLQNPGSTDLVAVAYLRERIGQLDESYDKSPSTALLGPAGQAHGQVMYLREHATNARVRKALFEVEAESATFMGQLVWDVSQRRDHHGGRALATFALPAHRPQMGQPRRRE